MSDQLSFFPITNKFFAEARESIMNSKWTASKVINDITKEKDQEHFAKLTDEEKNFIISILVFFLIGDGEVEKIIAAGNEELCATRRSFEIQKNSNEDVHNEVYSRLLNIFWPMERLTELSKNYLQEDYISAKLNWCKKVVPINRDFALVGMEGIFFSASFCSIFYFKSRDILPCISASNEYIARDEGFHTDCNIYAYNEGVRLDEKIACDLMKEAVDIEKIFIRKFCPNLPGLNADMLCQYIEYIADCDMVAMKHEKIYNTMNPITFMSSFGKASKADFFSQKPTEYTVYVTIPLDRNADDIAHAIILKTFE